MRIVIDTREQRPLDFTLWPEVTTTSGALHVGDYSLAGFEGSLAIERKSLADLVGSVTRDRERFERELRTLRGYELAAIVVEADMVEVLAHAYRGQASPDSVLQSLAAFHVRYRVPTLWAGSREGAAYMVRALCRHYLADTDRRLKALDLHRKPDASTATRPTVANRATVSTRATPTTPKRTESAQKPQEVRP